MSKNFKIKNDKKKESVSKSQSEMKIATIVISSFLVVAMLCALAVSGLGSWVDNMQKPTATATPYVDNTVIEFGDEKLENFIKKKNEITTDDVTVNQVKVVTTLTINDKDLSEITSLKGLEMFPSLTSLSISNAKIMDISALADAKDLTNISFYSCDITEATSEKENKVLTSLYIDDTLPNAQLFSKFTAVTRVDTNETGMKDLSGFAGMSAVEVISFEGEKNLESAAGIGAMDKLGMLSFEDCVVAGFDGVKDAKLLDTVTGEESTFSNLSALAQCSTLEVLQLAGCEVSNPDQIGSIKTLNELNIDGVNESKLDDIDFVKKLTNLEALSINGLKVGSLAAVADLKSLTLLYASECDLKNISSLKKLTNMETLDISGNSVSDLSALEDMKSLVYLDVSKNNIKNVNALENVMTLLYLDVSENEGITTLKGLDHMWVLEELYAADCKISAVSLEENTELLKVVLSGNKIENVDDISRLISATSIDLSDNSIKTLPDMSSMAALKAFYVANNQIESIDNLEKVTTLTTLDISGNKIKDAKKLEKLTSMVSLYIGKNEITDISFASKLTKLETFHAQSNGIEKTEAIASLTSMKSLDLSGNKIAKLDDLQKLTSLESVYLSDNVIEDITALANKKTIKVLDLTNNKVTEVASLMNCIGLDTLKLKGNSITNYSPIDSLKIENLETDLTEDAENKDE